MRYVIQKLAASISLSNIGIQSVGQQGVYIFQPIDVPDGRQLDRLANNRVEELLACLP